MTCIPVLASCCSLMYALMYTSPCCPPDSIRSRKVVYLYSLFSLFSLCSRGNIELVKFFVEEAHSDKEWRDIFDYTPLHLASE